MFCRASSLAPGATESSRSMKTSSAGRPGAFDSIFGEDPGTDRHDRRGLVTRWTSRIRISFRTNCFGMLVAFPDTRHRAAGSEGGHAMTYSIVARDPSTGELGVAVQTCWFGVGA